MLYPKSKSLLIDGVDFSYVHLKISSETASIKNSFVGLSQG